MIYITGEGETIDDLRKKEGFQGSPIEYLKKFKEYNGLTISVIVTESYTIPPYTPVFLVSEPPLMGANTEAVQAIMSFPVQDRKVLKDMQDSHHDIVTQITMADILQEAQSAASTFRQIYDSPLIATPWKDFNDSLHKSALLDMFGEAAGYTGGYLKHSTRYSNLDNLAMHLYARDALNTEMARLDKLPGTKAIAQRMVLQDQIKHHTRMIKQELPKKIDSTMSKYLKNFTPDEVRKMRMDSYSKKMARKGRLATTELDVLNKTGLQRLQRLIPKFIQISKSVGRFSILLGFGVVAYDIIKAHQDQRFRTALTGVAGLGAAYGIGAMSGGMSTLGGLTIGAIAGDTALGAGILLSMPVVGWVVLTGVGLAVAGYGAYKAAEFVGDLWDEYGGKITHELFSAASSVYDEIRKAWHSGSRWIFEFYGHHAHPSGS